MDPRVKPEGDDGKLMAPLGTRRERSVHKRACQGRWHFCGSGIGGDLALSYRQTLPKKPQNQRELSMQYLHTMVRVKDLDASLDFYCNKLGLKEVRRMENDKGRYTLVFLAAPEDEQRARADKAPLVELTYNWDSEDYKGGRNFGHLAYAVDDIYATCQRLKDGGVTINRPPRDGRMAFVRSPDDISIELLQKGGAKPPAEPWASMPNSGQW